MLITTTKSYSDSRVVILSESEGPGGLDGTLSAPPALPGSSLRSE